MIMLKLNTRYYRTIPLDRQGYEFEEIEIDPTRTTLAVMHCWDIGCKDGPPIDNNFFVGMGSLDSYREALRIMKEAISPSMSAARDSKILVSHVEHENIWKKHKSCRGELDDEIQTSGYMPAQVVSGWQQKIIDRSHGADYAVKSPYAEMDRAGEVSIEPDEPVVCQTSQFDRVLRKRGIENIVYTGFCADLCILRAQGGIDQMAKFGYRILLMRDATVGIEFPDTVEDMISTRWAIRFFETHYGDTITCRNFLEACNKLK